MREITNTSDLQNDLKKIKKEICCIGMTKRKIEERLEEHIHYLKYNNQTTVHARLNIATPIKINRISIEKCANYDALHNALIREAITILLY